MKKTATNQFSNGMNLDLHPIVTPNSVLTDNLNGTFITYNGNEFCLQNDRGNTYKAQLSEGFVPIGIKERNGILYIVSCNDGSDEKLYKSSNYTLAGNRNTITSTDAAYIRGNFNGKYLLETIYSITKLTPANSTRVSNDSTSIALVDDLPHNSGSDISTTPAGSADEISAGTSSNLQISPSINVETEEIFLYTFTSYEDWNACVNGLFTLHEESDYFVYTNVYDKGYIVKWTEVLRDNYTTGVPKTEIGTFPGLDWEVEKETWTPINEENPGYAPIKTFIKSPNYTFSKDIYTLHASAELGPYFWDALLENTDFSITDAWIDSYNHNFNGVIDALISTGVTRENIKTLFENREGVLVINDRTVAVGEEWKWNLLDFINNTAFSKNGVPAFWGTVNQEQGFGKICWHLMFSGEGDDLQCFNTLFYGLSMLGDINMEEFISNMYNAGYKLSIDDLYRMFSLAGMSKSMDTSVIENFKDTLEDQLKSLLKKHGSDPDKPYDERDSTHDWFETKIGKYITDLEEDQTFEDLQTELFGYDLKHPVTIEIQDSYDGSVNLILTDNNNKPRIINSGFSVSGNQYKIIERQKFDWLTPENFDALTNLTKNPVSFANFKLNDVLASGRLMGGNYTFYARFGDADGNKTPVLAESGVVAVFKGTVGLPSTISGTLANERTDKAISLSLEGIPQGYTKLYLSYVREFSDTQGFLQEEAFDIEKPYDITIKNSGAYVCDMLVTGYENTTAISIEDLNITYHTQDRIRTMAQQQDMLFVGNLSNVTYDYGKMIKIAKTIRTSISASNPESVTTWDYIAPVDATYTTDGEYFNVQNIYSKVGYWPNEYYRFGVVFILANGQNTEVFNMNGGEVQFNVFKSKFDDEYANEYGVFHTPKEGDRPIIETGSIIPWHFEFDFSDTINAIQTEGLTDVISGYFIVRQKRIPEVITQGLQVPIAYSTHVPVLRWNGAPIIESFVHKKDDYDPDKTGLLEYAAETAEGKLQKPTAAYERTYVINVYHWRLKKWYAYAGWGLTIPGLVDLLIPECIQGGTLYVTINYDENGTAQSVRSVSTNNLENVYAAGTKDIWFYPLPENSTYNWSWVMPPRDNPHAVDNVADFIAEACARRSDDGFPGKLVLTEYQKDPSYVGDDTPSIFEDHIHTTDISDNTSALLSVEAMVTSTIKNRLDGSKIELEPIYRAYTEDGVGIAGRHQTITHYFETKTATSVSTEAVYVNSDNAGKVIGDAIFATRVGDALDVSNYGNIYHNNKLVDENTGVVRGRFTPYVGLLTGVFNEGEGKSMTISQISARVPIPQNAITIRQQDNSPYYCVSDRFSVLTTKIPVYRGDCFVVTQSIRMNYNFIDPEYPFVERILSEGAWKQWGPGGSGRDGHGTDAPKWDEINRVDVNTASIGHWVTFKCLASSNVNLRSEDPFDTAAMAMMGNPKSFYPLAGSTSSAAKQQESELFNAGYGVTTSSVRRVGYVELPYIKQEYENRIMFSNKNVTDAFVNGYRVFQGASYHDYDKQYGTIVKLEPWKEHLLCVFEHGIGLVSVNERALLQTTTDQTIHIYGHGVLSDQMTVVSPDYGTKYEHTIVRTPIGLYGIDTDGHKIWRVSEQKGFETISDMKVETYLNKYLDKDFDIELSKTDIRTHYNEFKGDVMFTWYKDDKLCSICFNERQNLWTTKYDWVPIVSENRNGKLYSLQYNENNIDLPVGIYDHDPVTSEVTKWYNKQHPFEFEFVVSDPIGYHKIYEALQIISNNVQPEVLQFEFIGDAYLFNKARIYHTVYAKPDLSKRGWKSIDTAFNSSNLTNYTDAYSKPNILENDDYTPFKNSAKLVGGDTILSKIKLSEGSTNQYHLVIPQECRNIETWGRRLGNIQYKNDVWSTTIEPILYDARLDDPTNTNLINPVNKWNSARIRDKWCKIRVRYSGEDLAIITAIKTIVNV